MNKAQELQGQVMHIEGRALSVDAEKKTVEFVLSTEDIDRHGDIVDQESWLLDAFRKNPVLLEQHKGSEFPLGKWVKVWTEPDANNPGKIRLAGIAEFAVDIYDRAKVGFDLLAGGFMNAVSVGFIPHVVEYDEQKDAYILKNCELVECSLVSVPSNRMALAKARGINVDGYTEERAAIKEKVIAAKKEIEESIAAAPAAEKSGRAQAVELLNKAVRRLKK